MIPNYDAYERGGLGGPGFGFGPVLGFGAPGLGFGYPHHHHYYPYHHHYYYPY
ncbi:hypothetical protein FB550_1347 [Neobacillus bataviensis]|uniref:Uncharacterized protein n=1 Tax=Neobacillus bataviensis TaxID=220685 RepID=A0A561CAC6_9BACI|nr:hypothetical protein [Neobacillus bataviensis]TWD87882.1 hypothetical protein FB550_1347 [Neobacillus bataviensis]